MDQRTGDVYNLNAQEDARRALKAMEAGELQELVEVKEQEIERLQSLSRKERRAALKGKPRIEREELKRRLFEASRD